MDCYVLVGGLSRRMGVPKASLDLGGVTFLSRVVAAASGAFGRVVAVERADGIPVAGVTTIYETRHPDQAPIFGLARALSAASDKCFVLALDYPLLTAATLRELRARFEASPAPMLVPLHRGIPQTLCAGYSPAMREMIDGKIASRRYDLRSLVELAEFVPVEGDEWLNVNTPGELEEARRRHDH